MEAIKKFLFAGRWRRELIALQVRQQMLSRVCQGQCDSYYFDKYVETCERIAVLQDRLS